MNFREPHEEDILEEHFSRRLSISIDQPIQSQDDEGRDLVFKTFWNFTF